MTPRFVISAVLSFVAGWLWFSGPERSLVAGRHYRATFVVSSRAEMLPGFLEGLRSIMPAGAAIDVSPEDNVVRVSFVAPTTAKLEDVSIPGGTLKLRQLERIS